MDMNLFALSNNWNVLADPFYQMKDREGYALDTLKTLTPNEAVRVVLGDELADRVIKNGQINGANSVQTAMFAAFCYLRLRQKDGQLQFPLEIDMPFHFADPTTKKTMYIAGLSLLKQYGRYVSSPNSFVASMKQYRTIVNETNTIQNLCDTYKLAPAFIKQAILTGVMAAQGENFKLLTYSACQPVIEKMFGVGLDNIVYVDHNWTRCFDFNATAQDVATVIDWLAGALSKGGVSPIEVTAAEDGFSVWMDAFEFRVTKKDGVFEMGRNLRFNNMLLVTSLTGRAESERIPANDLSLVNSYGTFLYGLMMLGSTYLTQAIPELGQLVSKKLLVELPCSSDDEARAYDADRATYDRYVTVTRMSACDLPIGFARYCINGEWNTKVTYNRDLSVSALADTTSEKGGTSYNAGTITGSKLPAKNAVDQAALLGFNLVRMPRGQFIDARRSCIQAKHIPAELREQFVRDVLAGMVAEQSDAAIAQYCRDVFDLQGEDTKVIKGVSEHLIIGLSSKLAKLIKRTAMDAACVGTFEKSGGRGLNRVGQKGQSTNNMLIEAVVSPHAIFPAGMAAYWGESPKLLVKHTQSVQPSVPGVVNDIATAVQPLFNGDVVESAGWQVVRYARPVQLEDNEPVADVPYTVNGENHRHTIINNVPSALLTEIRWRNAKVQGNSTTLQIQVVTQTRETQIKGRNNVKCMLSRYTSDVVINELNPAALNTRSVFFADTNKWLDLVLSLVDVASCTAIQNNDVVGVQLVKAANALVHSNSVDSLEWSPVLAVLGAYQPLVDWFESKYGRAVWFRHADPTGEWTNILKVMYKQSDWQHVETTSVGYAIPIGATDVMVLTDGPLTDDHTNILAFYSLDGVDYFVQRAWSYAGTNQTGPVWQPVKGELSSVRASVGTTPLMSGVARAVEQADPAYAQRLAKDGYKQIHKSAVFFAMSKNQTIKAKGGVELPMHMLGDVSASALLQTAELKELVSLPENAGKLLKLLAPLFKDVMFSICCGTKGHFSVYLPAVLMQDSASDFKSVDGLSDLITRLFVLYIQGVPSNDNEFLLLAGRAKAALHGLTNSAGLIKSGAFCRTAMQAKTQSLPGIPLNEVWVRESSRASSVCQVMGRVFK